LTHQRELIASKVTSEMARMSARHYEPVWLACCRLYDCHECLGRISVNTGLKASFSLENEGGSKALADMMLMEQQFTSRLA
jgi:hypothetical protein